MNQAASDAAPYYSQHGEDVVIAEAFADVPRGWFCEVGCIDGRLFSNTLRLEEQGWRGVCVEAHPDYIPALRANRARSIVVHCAVGDRDAVTTPFFANARGSLSTLDRSLESEYADRYGRYFMGFQEISLPMRTISSILDQHRVPPLDVLSIDIEGCDDIALKGLDLSRHRPGLIIVEADRPHSLASFDARLVPSGYSRPFAVSNNWFYFRDADRAARVVGRVFEAEITRTGHPLDADPPSVVAVTIRT